MYQEFGGVSRGGQVGVVFGCQVRSKGGGAKGLGDVNLEFE